MNDSSSARGTFRDVLLITFVAGVLFLPSLLTRDLWNPDEPRYMEVAREMVLLDDYLVPHLNDKPYPDKPPMFFWLAAGLYRVGLGYDSGRMVAALASLGTALLTYFIARLLLSRQGELFAALTTLTTALFLITSKIGVIDPLLALFTTASIYCGLRAMDGEGRRSRGWWLASYATAGLAVLTKGPVGLIVPAIVLVACKYSWGGKARKGGWIHLPGALLLLAIVAAWLVPALTYGGADYADNILFRQTAGRIWRSYSHRNPVYYYLLDSAWLFLPWTLFFVAAVWSAMKAWWRPNETAARMGLVWFGAVFVFFTLVSGKRVGYLMPLMPAFGLIMGRYFVLVGRAEHSWHKAHKVFVIITLAIVAAGLVAAVPAVAVAGRISQLVYPGDGALAQDVLSVMKGSLSWTIAVAATGIAIAFTGWRATWRYNKHAAVLPALILLTALISLFADVVLLPRANHFKSGRNLVRAGKAYLKEADSLFLYYKDFDGVYNLCTGRVAIPLLEKPNDLEHALASPMKVAVIGHEKHVHRALGTPLRAGRIVASARVGHRKMLVITNWIQDDAQTSAVGLNAEIER